MHGVVSIATAANLLEQSERTLRRRISEGLLQRIDEVGGTNRTMIPLSAIRDQIVLPLEGDDLELIGDADAGIAEAQNDLALLFLANGKPQGAIYWLDLAAKQEYPDAMHCLARCYIDGNGVPRNDDLGLMWLAKAAAHGHVISKAQMQSMRETFITNP